MTFVAYDAHKSAYTRKYVYCGIMILCSQLSGKDYMSVNDTSHRIGNRLVGVIAFYKHGVNSRNASTLKAARSFKQLRHIVIYRACISSHYWRLSNGKTHVPFRHGKTGKVIHHQQYVLTLLHKIFRNGGGRLRTLASHHGGLIACGYHNDGALHAFFAQIVFYELSYLTATFSYESNNVKVGLDLFCNHSHKGTFTYSGTGKYTYSLTLAQSTQTVYRLYAQFQRLRNLRTRQRVYRYSGNGHFVGIVNFTAVIQRITDCIDNTSDKGASRFYHKLLTRVVDYAARSYAFDVGIWHQKNFIRLKSYRFRKNKVFFASLLVNPTDVAYIAFRSAGFNGHPYYFFYFSHTAPWLKVRKRFGKSS